MFDVKTLLDALQDANVRFIVIGGVATMAQGSAHVTQDLDVCHEHSKENCARIVEALAPLEPRLRGTPPDLPFQWDAETLVKGSNFTLATDAGPIDLLAHVKGLGDYDDVKALAETIELYDHAMNVLSLDGLIQSKEATGRDKDKRMLPELRSLRHLRREESNRA